MFIHTTHITIHHNSHAFIRSDIERLSSSHVPRLGNNKAGICDGKELVYASG